MRIPVYPDDLIRNRGFKSLAKQLHQLLHGPSRIPLTFAYEILAKGFGYASYYDLQQTAKACQQTELTVNAWEAKRAIVAGIQAALQNGKTTASEQELKRLVDSFTLESLVAFKRSRYVSMPGKPELTANDVRALERVVRSSGKLRDQALFACMQTGMRATEYLPAIYFNQFGAYLPNKAGCNAEYSSMPKSCQGSIAIYAAAEKLSEGDLLFPSAKHPMQPMSVIELKKLLAAWGREANIRAEALTAFGIRKFSIKGHLGILF
jgi:hypothetical protein